MLTRPKSRTPHTCMHSHTWGWYARRLTYEDTWALQSPGRHRGTPSSPNPGGHVPFPGGAHVTKQRARQGAGGRGGPLLSSWRRQASGCWPPRWGSRLCRASVSTANGPARLEKTATHGGRAPRALALPTAATAGLVWEAASGSWAHVRGLAGHRRGGRASPS